MWISKNNSVYFYFLHVFFFIKNVSDLAGKLVLYDIKAARRTGDVSSTMQGETQTASVLFGRMISASHQSINHLSIGSSEAEHVVICLRQTQNVIYVK